MRTSSRDLGLNHGPGKGDADRTDRKKYLEGIHSVEGLTGLADKTGYKKVGLSRWRKTYGSVPTEGSKFGNPPKRPRNKQRV